MLELLQTGELMKNPIDDSRITHKVQSNKVATGDLMAFTYYVTIDQVNPVANFLRVKDIDNGGIIDIRGKELIENSYSANQFTEEVYVSKTKAAEILVSSHNRPFTVSFQKTDGSERVLRGRLIRPEPLLGRSVVEDLETKDSNRIRQIDHRTINFIIIECVKYIVK